MLAILRYHLAASARLALRELAGPFAVLVAALGFMGSDFVNSFADALFRPDPALGPRALIVLAAVALTRVAARRLLPGTGGWLRHLPCDGTSHRRAAWIATTVAALPLPLTLAPLALLRLQHDPAAIVTQLLALLLVTAAAALASLPTSRWGAAPLALAGALLAGWGSPLMLGLAALLLAFADAVAGPLAPPVRARLRETVRRSVPSPARFWWRVLHRAVGWGAQLAAAAAGLVPLLLGLVFVDTNGLAGPLRASSLRLACGIGIVLQLARLVEAVERRRPEWSWSRSLPWSSLNRARLDAIAALFAGLPLLALATVLAGPTVLWLAPLLLFLACRAAGVLRRPRERRVGAAGVLTAEGLLLAAVTALVPWLGLALLVLVPAALAAAASADRELRVSTWQERRHLAAGDPQSSQP